MDAGFIDVLSMFYKWAGSEWMWQVLIAIDDEMPDAGRADATEPVATG